MDPLLTRPQAGEIQKVPVGDDTFFIEGKLDKYIIVSAPLETPIELAKQIKEAVERLTNQPACVVSHNIYFLKATKLSSAEAGKILKEVEDNG